MKLDMNQFPTAAPVPGKSYFLLGQSTDGPVNTPVIIRSIEEAKRIFGEGNLIEAYAQAEKVENITIHLMRISGEYGRLSLLGDIDSERPVLSMRSVSAGERYNRIRIYTKDVERAGVLKKALIIEPPDTDIPGKSYVLEDYQTLQQLVYDINRDTRLRGGWVYASTLLPYESPDILGDLNTAPISMSGGHDGLDLTKDELYIALDASYSILEGREVDVICPYPARLDDSHPHFYYNSSQYGNAFYAKGDYLGLVDTENGGRNVTFHEQLIDFCRTQERFGITTHGVIGLREVEDHENLPSYYMTRLLMASAFMNRYGFVAYGDGAWVDKGHYISVFAQDFAFEDHQFEANGCALYGALIASLDHSGTTTGMKVPEGIGLAFEMEADELKDLGFIGAVAARSSVKNGIVITNGVTAGLPESPFRSIQNIRMVQFTLYILNHAIESSVGEAFVPVVTLKELDRRVKEALTHCVELGVVKSFEYGIKFDSYSNGVLIQLGLTPRNSTESIEAKASLKFSTGGDSE